MFMFLGKVVHNFVFMHSFLTSDHRNQSLPVFRMVQRRKVGGKNGGEWQRGVAKHFLIKSFMEHII